MTNGLTDLAEDSVSGGTTLLVGEGVFMIMTGLGSILIARLLGPSDFALYSLALVLPTFLFSISNFGIDNAVVRYTSKLQAGGNNEAAIQMIMTGAGMRITVATLTSIGGIFISSAFAEIVLGRALLAPYVQFGCFAVLFQAIFLFGFRAFQGLNKMSWSGLIRATQATTKTGISVLFLILGFGVIGAISGFVLSYLMTATMCVALIGIIYKRSRKSTRPRYQLGERIKMIIGFGVPLYAGILLAGLIIQYRIFLLALYSPNVEIGNFSAAVNLTVVLTSISFPLVASLFPAFARINSGQTVKKASDAFATAVKYVSMAVVPSAVMMIVLSQDISDILYTSAYNQTAFFLALLSIQFLLVGVGNGVLESYFNGMGENKLTLMFWTVYLVSFVPAGLYLTIHYGTVGLIAAELLSRSLACISGLVVGKRKLGLRLWKMDLVGIYFSAAVAGLMVLFLKIALSWESLVILPIGFALFFVVYITLLPLAGAIKLSDIEMLENVYGSIRGINLIAKPVLRYERYMLTIKSRN